MATDKPDKTHADIIAKLKSAKRKGVPIAAINTPDQPALVRLLTDALNGKTAVFAWDFCRGLHAANDAAVKALADLGMGDQLAETRLNPMGPIMALEYAQRLPAGAVLFYFNAQRFIQDAGVCQGLMNLRDDFKSSQTMIVLVGTGIKLPAEISSDVIQWNDPLPADDRLLAIVGEQVSAVDEKQFASKPTPAQMKQAAIALRGTSAFGAEQLAAMALNPQGIDQDTLHTQAKAVIEQTAGLSYERGGETFDDIRGLAFAQEFGTRLFKGPKPPAIVVRVEELEKSMAGSKGDLSGVSGDALQVLLTSMEDNNFSGLLAYGLPGSGKTLFAKAMANTFGAKALRLDLNACRGSLVGQSEQMVRRAMEVIATIGGNNVFLVASCNRLEAIPPELQRRFRAGVWFFDLPGTEERRSMWQMYRRKYSIPADEPEFDEPDLSGADVRNTCEIAYSLRCTLAEARRFIVPLKSQSPQGIVDSRTQAQGRFTCANFGGTYQLPDRRPKASGRKVQV